MLNMNLKHLMNLSTAKKFPKNSVIISEGDSQPYSMYFLLSGSVRVVKNYGGYNQVVVATLNKGDFFGEMSLFLLKPRSATVVTADETVALEITQLNVYELIEKNPQVLYHILKVLCTRIDNLNDRVRSLPPRH